MIKAWQHFKHQIESLKKLDNERPGFFFFFFGANTYSLYYRQDVLKGLLCANRLNTHITQSPSFLISLSFITIITVLRS